MVLTVNVTFPPLAGTVAGDGSESVNGQEFAAWVIVIGRPPMYSTVLWLGPV